MASFPQPPTRIKLRRDAIIHAIAFHDDMYAVGDDEAEFSSWLSDRLSSAAGADVHADLFAECLQCVLRWRRRYRGNPRLWRSLFKGEKVIKEIVEAAPVIAAARDVVAAA